MRSTGFNVIGISALSGVKIHVGGEVIISQLFKYYIENAFYYTPQPAPFLSLKHKSPWNLMH